MKLPSPGQIFEDNYRIEEVLGEGGFGRVYKATAFKQGRTVAIKVLKPDGGADAARRAKRFEREAQIVANLTHPNTLTLFEHGQTADGLRYIVSEYVDGDSLTQLLARGRRFSERECAHVLEQLLESLAEAHGVGVLHRDLKPDNILLFEHFDDPLRVRLLDFGIAKLFDDDARLTGTGMSVGTPRYMSPDQLLGLELTPASDLYSVGLIAMEMLLGREARQAFHATLADDAPVGPYLKGVINRLLEENPEDRYQSAAAVLRDLRAPKQRPAPPAPAPVEERLASPAQGRRRPIIASVVGALVFAAAVAVMLHRDERPAGVSPVAKRSIAGLVADEGDDGLPAAARDADVREDAATVAHGASACEMPPPFVGRGYLRHMEGLSASEHLAYIPTTYAPGEPLPLVLLLHDKNNVAATLFDDGGFVQLAEAERFVLVAPQLAASLKWSEERAVFDRALRETNELLCIDEDQIFVVGQGEGGWLAEALTCSSRIAGAATHGHSRNRPTPHNCDPAPAAPFIALHPRHSERAPFEGGRPCNSDSNRWSVPEAEQNWRDRNACSGPRQTTFEYGESACYTWTCETSHESCHLDGGHRWPGLPPRTNDFRNCDGPSTDFPAAERIWKFFDEIDEGGGF